MNNIFTRYAGIASIAILLSSVVIAPAAAAAPPAEDFPTFTNSREGVSVPVLLRPSRGTAPRMSVEASRAFSPAAKDRHGYEKSLYRGKYYRADQEGFRRCVMDRESNFSYRAANGSSSARGAYQFLDNSWRDGLVHMMRSESRKTNDGLRDDAKSLFNKPIHTWSRYWQDRAWFTAMNYNGAWSGKHHWNPTVAGTGC